MKELKELSRFISDFHLETSDPEVRQAAVRCTLDTIGAALGAKSTPMFSSIKSTYLSWDGSGGYTASLWGDKQTASLKDAIFLNSMMGHILELDDVHTKSKTHIGTVVIPAAWCLAEQLGATGKDFLEAVICGYETMARIGMGFGVSSHRNRGWHVTGTAGTFGAAAACAKLLHFDKEQILAAFGLAGTQSCSTWAFLSDGATNKVLHPARAAANGLESCMLVLGGMRGSAHILDAEDGGIFPMMSDEYDYSLVSQGLGDVFEILHMDNKPYPCCRSTHCAIDAALELREKYHIDSSAIASVSVGTYLVGYKQCGLTENSKHPLIPTDAKFSTPYTVARALMNGKIGLDDFTPECIQDPATQNLLAKITVSPDNAFTDIYPDHWGCQMTIFMNDGSTYSQTIQDASGSVITPLSEKQLLTKVHTCCGCYPQSWIQTLTEQLLSLPSLKQLPSLNPYTDAL